MGKIKKRFIAGAKCPACNKIDTLMLFFENNVEKLECVACGYSQSQENEAVSSANNDSGNIIGVFKPD